MTRLEKAKAKVASEKIANTSKLNKPQAIREEWELAYVRQNKLVALEEYQSIRITKPSQLPFEEEKEYTVEVMYVSKSSVVLKLDGWQRTWWIPKVVGLASVSVGDIVNLIMWTYAPGGRNSKAFKSRSKVKVV